MVSTQRMKIENVWSENNLEDMKLWRWGEFEGDVFKSFKFLLFFGF
jgi:hypothetical protein